ncbi:MAG: hypothetical protein WBD41_18390 [Rhodococcus sp. (in: high G+C Gram-positive bacteria)]
MTVRVEGAMVACHTRVLKGRGPFADLDRPVVKVVGLDRHWARRWAAQRIDLGGTDSAPAQRDGCGRQDERSTRFGHGGLVGLLAGELRTAGSGACWPD